jgi:hypothetical protein
MSVFSAAIDAIFTDPNMAADAVWKSRQVGPAIACRVILKRPDDFRDYGSAQIVSSAVLADVRVSEVPDPQKGDRIEIGADWYDISARPTRDRERLVWTMELLPR